MKPIIFCFLLLSSIALNAQATTLADAARSLADGLARSYSQSSAYNPNGRKPLLDISKNAFADPRSGAVYPFSAYLVTELRRALANTQLFAIADAYDSEHDLIVAGAYYQESGKLVIVAHINGYRRARVQDDHGANTDLANARVELPATDIDLAWLQLDIRNKLFFLLHRLEQKAKLTLPERRVKTMIHSFRDENATISVPLGRYLKEAAIDYLSGSYQFLPVDLNKLKPTLTRSKSIPPTTNVQATLTTLADIPYYIEGSFWIMEQAKLELRVRLADQHGQILASESMSVNKHLVDPHLLRSSSVAATSIAAAYQTLKPQTTNQFRIEVFTQKGRDDLVFSAGEAIRLHIKLNRNGFVHILNRSTDGQFYQIFPNRFHANTEVAANRVVVIPDENYGFELKVQPPFGYELIKVYAGELALPLLPGTDIGGAFTRVDATAQAIQEHYQNFMRQKNTAVVEDIIYLQTTP